MVKSNFTETKILEKVIKRVINLFDLDDELLFEWEVLFKEKEMFARRVDAVGYYKNKKDNPFVIIEVKSPNSNLKIHIEQVKDLISITKAKFGVLSNGNDYYFFENKSDHVQEILSLPKKGSNSYSVKISKKELSKIAWTIFDILRDEVKYEDMNSLFIELLVIIKYDLKYNKQLLKKIRNSLTHGQIDILREIKSILRKDEPELMQSDLDLGRILHPFVLFRCIDFLLTIDFSKFTEKDWEVLVDESLIYLERKESYSGEYLTTSPVVTLLSKLIEVKDNEKILDIASGIGNILRELSSSSKAEFVGHEINEKIIQLGKYIFFLLDRKINFILGDSLQMPEDEKFDKIICHAPFGVRIRENYSFYGLSSKFSDSLFLLKSMQLLKDKGYLYAIVPKGYLSRTTKEKEIRKFLLKEFSVKCVIDFPAGIHPNTAIKTSLLIIQKSKSGNATTLMSSLQYDETQSKKNYAYFEQIDEIIKIIKKYLNTIKPINKENYNDFFLETTNITYSVDINQDVDMEKKSAIVYLVSYDEIESQDYDLSLELYDPNYKRKLQEIRKKYPLKKLSDVAEIVPGEYVSSEDYLKNEEDVDGPYLYYIRIKDIFDGEVDPGNAFIIPDTDKINHDKVIMRNDILLSISGTIGKAGIYPYDNLAIASKGLVIIRPKNNLDPYYFLSILNNKFVKEQLSRYASEGVISHLSLEVLRNIEIPILPLNEQKKKEFEAKKLRKEIEQLDIKKNELKQKIKDLYKIR